MRKRLLPPAYFWICLVVAVGLHFVVPIAQLLHSPYRHAGALLVVFGLWVNLWADAMFKRAETTVKPFEKPSALILEGPFRFSRHPMYLGMVAALLGVAIALGSLISFLAPIAFFVTMSVLFIPEEERSLEDTFGEEYSEYRGRVRCWL